MVFIPSEHSVGGGKIGPEGDVVGLVSQQLFEYLQAALTITHAENEDAQAIQNGGVIRALFERGFELCQRVIPVFTLIQHAAQSHAQVKAFRGIVKRFTQFLFGLFQSPDEHQVGGKLQAQTGVIWPAFFGLVIRIQKARVILHPQQLIQPVVVVCIIRIQFNCLFQRFDRLFGTSGQAQHRAEVLLHVGVIGSETCSLAQHLFGLFPVTDGFKHQAQVV